MEHNEKPESISNIEVYSAAIEVLVDATDESPMSVKQLMEGISKRIKDPPKSYLVYRDINAAAQDPTSRIRSRKGRSGGYFLATKSQSSESEVAPTKQELQQEKTLEKHIWPLVSLWLSETKQIPGSSYEIANLKRGGVWSNPDVVGLNPIEELGFFDVEITTVEVKPSLSQWRYYFFEAVSHKRFSERAYFIYRKNGDEQRETDELKRYAEKYSVGLVELELSDDDYKSLTKWDKMNYDDKSALLEYFVEIMPAPFEAISIREKIGFLRQLGIESKGDIYTFGSSS